MGVFEMVVFIVMIVTIGGVLKHRAHSRHRMDDLEEQLRECGVADQLKRIDTLEERIRTLERIVTDSSERLRRDIDAL